MLDYYDITQLIQNLDILISAKEKELEFLKSILNSDIATKVKIQQLQSEINEIRIQKEYYNNSIQDQLMSNCSGSCNCCRNKNYFK